MHHAGDRALRRVALCLADGLVKVEPFHPLHLAMIIAARVVEAYVGVPRAADIALIVAVCVVSPGGQQGQQLTLAR